MDFANILFAGPCNQHCPGCIGRRMVRFTGTDTLGAWPLPGFGTFVRRCLEIGISEISVSGVNTDPLLYRHLDRLISEVRRLVPGARLSLHTNGRFVPETAATVNRFDRVTVSFASFDRDTNRLMTGLAEPLDLHRVLGAVQRPVKVSVLVDRHNAAEVRAIIRRCRALGVRRMVLRRPFGERGPWSPLGPVRAVRSFAGNPVVAVDGVEITLWDFARSRLTCLNLFPDGSLGSHYLIAAKGDASELRTPPAA